MSERARAGARDRRRPARRARKDGRSRTSAANGAKGGRPRDRVPDEVLKRLGDVPTDAKALRLWNARLIAEVLVLSMRGEVGPELAATIRTTATALDRALPRDPGESEPGGDLDDDDEPEGPELEDDPGGEPLRVGG